MVQTIYDHCCCFLNQRKEEHRTKYILVEINHSEILLLMFWWAFFWQYYYEIIWNFYLVFQFYINGVISFSQPIFPKQPFSVALGKFHGELLSGHQMALVLNLSEFLGPGACWSEGAPGYWSFPHFSPGLKIDWFLSSATPGEDKSHTRIPTWNKSFSC